MRQKSIVYVFCFWVVTKYPYASCKLICSTFQSFPFLFCLLRTKFCGFVCVILVTLCSLLSMSIFNVWSLSLDCIRLITARTLVPLITHPQKNLGFFDSVGYKHRLILKNNPNIFFGDKLIS